MQGVRISKLFDSTLLNPDVSREQVVDFIVKSVQWNVRAVSVPWCYVPLAERLTENSDVGIVVGVDFPFGYSPLEIKIEQINYYSNLSAKITDFDVVLNLCAVKSRDWQYVRREAEEIAKCVKSKGKICKIIVEVSRLGSDELRKVCELIVDIEGLDYVKTGTGFGPRPTSCEDIVAMREVLAGRKMIKVSGGVRTAEQVEQFLKLGASLFGSSRAVEILQELERRAGNDERTSEDRERE